MDTVKDKGKPRLQEDILPSPEDMEKLEKLAQKESRLQEDPAFGRAKHPKEKSTSAAFKSQERTMNAMGAFFVEVGKRHKNRGYCERIFTDEKVPELTDDCNDYINFCMEHGIIPTWHLLSVWLDVTPSTLWAEESLSSKCAAVLQKVRTVIFTILEQSTLQREGNPAAGIFFLKSLWGLSDQQPLDVNVHMDAPRQMTGVEAKTVIDLLPDEVYEK